MENILLVVEKSNEELYGRIQYEDDLIIESAKNIASLERKMKKLLHDFHDLQTEDIVFEYAYDVTALFSTFNYLKITSIARKANLNAALLRQYASGVKHPSPAQAKKLEDAIHQIGKELSSIAVFAA